MMSKAARVKVAARKKKKQRHVQDVGIGAVHLHYLEVFFKAVGVETSE